MNQETIENHIKNLGKQDFDGVATLIVTRVFSMSAIDVDGKGDGGSDFRVFEDAGRKRTIAIQKTVQDSRWKEKALEDARKAKASLAATIFFFLTTRSHEPTSFRKLENDIASELGMPATCLGATEIAGLILENGLLGSFARAIGLPLDISLQHRPDSHEIMLHSYVALSDDRANLREGIIDDTIQLTLHVASNPLQRDGLENKTLELSGLPESRRAHIQGRVDSLLSRGILQKTSDARLLLSPETAAQLKVADGIYVKELEQLASAQASLLNSHNVSWTAEQSKQAAVLLSQWFVQMQIATANRSSLQLSMTGFARPLGDPKDELRKLLIDSGVVARRVNEVLSELVELAHDRPIVKKLTRAVVYLALENVESSAAATVLQASNWTEVVALLDASVVIPYLCASMFEPTEGRFSRGANECIRVLKELKAGLVIPWVYVNECASHLVRALNYCAELTEVEDSLAYSQNGFVAQYYMLLRAGKEVPGSLREFLGCIARSVLVGESGGQRMIHAVMSDIQPLLRDFGVDYEDIGRVPDKYRRDIEMAYDFRLRSLGRSKSQTLVAHDVDVLCHLNRCVAERHERRICLTWDGAMIAVGKEESRDCGWVISPHEACDIIQPRLSLSGGGLMALAHSLARTCESASDYGGRIIDRIVELAHKKLPEWQFRQKIKTFRDEALSRVDPSNVRYADTIDRETDEFLKSEGIDTYKRDDVDYTEDD